jgi:hypothetical protein
MRQAAVLALHGGDPRQITLVSDARAMLAEARSLDEVKEIRDQAEAVRLYMRQRDRSLEAQNAAAEIKLWAERRAGELLREMPKNKGSRGKGVSLHDASTPRLSDLGIDQTESHRWQQIASLPERDFQRHIDETKAAEKDLTTNGMLKLAKSQNKERAPSQPKRERAPKAQGRASNGSTAEAVDDPREAFEAEWSRIEAAHKEAFQRWMPLFLHLEFAERLEELSKQLRASVPGWTRQKNIELSMKEAE